MSEQDKNETPNNVGVWRPKSTRVGIGPVRYVLWNMFYAVLETFNRLLARDKNRKVSWDKWPSFLGLFYLMAKIRFNRSNALTDPYDYATNDTKDFGEEPESVKHQYTPDGTWVSDREDPQMGSAHTRYSSNIPPKKVRPDVENMTPSAREVGKVCWRQIDPATGKEITIYARILNNLAAAWIQFQVHNFQGNTQRDPVAQCPHRIKRDPSEGWPGDEALIDRTTKDPTRLTDNGRPTVINEREQAWIQGQVYGSSEQELKALRSFTDGKLTIDSCGRLPEDPQKPGIDKTGFNNNFSPLLSVLHWLFVLEHNALCDHYKYFHPDWDDERLFQQARKANVGQIDRIHTVEWTADLLQHPTLQIGMHADWYGLVGQRTKMYLMRLSHRHPWIFKLLTPIRNIDIVWGMPGSKWEHHDGPFQVPTQFRMVYRLHPMLLSEYEILEPGTDRTLDRIALQNFVAHNTRPIVEKFGYETIAYSFVRKSCGALTLHNFPRYLTQFPNQQDGTLTDLAERDIFRERTDGTGTYNEFRLSLGEPPVTSFLELTGGDAPMAAELERLYEGDVDAVDAGIGILAEPKAAGFALGLVQFYQFVLNAPRRVKSNRHLTKGFTYDEYQEGMDWLEHGGGILGALGRHLPGLRSSMEGVVRGFAPWPDTETFPLRMLTKTYQDTYNVFKSDLRTFVLAAVVSGLSLWCGALAWPTVAVLLAALAAVPVALAVKRMLAMRFMEQVWQKCYTDKRAFMFGTLSRGERWINRASLFGRLQSLLVVAATFTLAWTLHAAHPWLAAAFVITGLVALSTRKWSKAFAEDALVLKVSLRNRMREGQTVTDAAKLPGETALQKRYWFLKGDNEKPVATFATCLRGLRQSGLPFWTAFSTSVLSLFTFGRKTQRGMTRQQKRAAGLGLRNFLSIYLPNIAQAMGPSSTRIYAPADNSKGLRAGDVDMEEFERTFRMFAPGRDYMTAYDFARMREGNRLRDAGLHRGNKFSRAFGQLAAKRRAAQLFQLFSDRVVEEDRQLVPAVSKDMLLRFYQGAAQYDLLLEHTEGDMDPSPRRVPAGWKELAVASNDQLTWLYRTGTVGSIPDGDSQGRAIVLPGWFLGRILSAVCCFFWKGKVVNAAKGELVNKILGMHIIHADVFNGPSWRDNKPAIIVDYKKRSWLAWYIRDEIRQIRPGLYLGLAYIRLPLGLRFPALFFALDFRK